jgi:hypothetical protein
MGAVLLATVADDLTALAAFGEEVAIVTAATDTCIAFLHLATAERPVWRVNLEL